MLPSKGFGTKPNGAQLSFQQMGVLDQTLQPVDQSVLSQQLDMPLVDLPPEDSNNLSRLVPELDLLDDKSKEKDKDDSDEEVRCLLFTGGRKSLILTLPLLWKPIPTSEKFY